MYYRCITCGSDGRLIKNECGACYQYRWKYKTPRPVHLWGNKKNRQPLGDESRKVCKNCGCREEELQRMKDGRNRINTYGECRTCYQHRLRHNGRSRPVKHFDQLVKDTGDNECECGQLVTKWPIVRLGDVVGNFNRYEKLPLCDDCYELFLEVETR